MVGIYIKVKANSPKPSGSLYVHLCLHVPTLVVYYRFVFDSHSCNCTYATICNIMLPGNGKSRGCHGTEGEAHKSSLRKTKKDSSIPELDQLKVIMKCPLSQTPIEI